MIGWVEFIEGNVTIKATMDDEGLWACEAAPHIAELLNREFPPVGDPAENARGHGALIKAAQRLRGIAWLGLGRPD